MPLRVRAGYMKGAGQQGRPGTAGHKCGGVGEARNARYGIAMASNTHVSIQGAMGPRRTEGEGSSLYGSRI